MFSRLPPELRSVRPKRPIYWSALALVTVSGTVCGIAIWRWEPVQALAVITPIITLWGVMVRGFFGGDEQASSEGGGSAQPSTETIDA